MNRDQDILEYLNHSDHHHSQAEKSSLETATSSKKCIIKKSTSSLCSSPDSFESFYQSDNFLPDSSEQDTEDTSSSSPSDHGIFSSADISSDEVNSSASSTVNDDRNPVGKKSSSICHLHLHRRSTTTSSRSLSSKLDDIIPDILLSNLNIVSSKGRSGSWSGSSSSHIMVIDDEDEEEDLYDFGSSRVQSDEEDNNCDVRDFQSQEEKSHYKDYSVKKKGDKTRGVVPQSADQKQEEDCVQHEDAVKITADSEKSHHHHYHHHRQARKKNLVKNQGKTTDDDDGLMISSKRNNMLNVNQQENNNAITKTSETTASYSSSSLLSNDYDSFNISDPDNYSCYINANNYNQVLINGKPVDMTSRRYAVLTFDQVCRLDGVMDSQMQIHGRGNFPTLEVKLKDLVQIVKNKLLADGVVVKDIRLNGGAASHVLSSEDKQHAYTDLDLIFGVELGNHRTFDKVRSAVLDSLLDFLPEGVNRKKISSCTLKEAYVHKMVKVTEGGDKWSLISLCNNTGRDIEIKFVDTMKRQFEFSVDSFQIILDSLLLYYECSYSMVMTENIYPTVVGDSVYGDFIQAFTHLQRKIIATRNPEEIRGGGLLKYCRLRVLGYRPVKYDEIKNLEKYMCSRFFIDFSDITVQRIKLANYLDTHFHDNDQVKYEYLMILQKVVDDSTVCLMRHERRQTLALIDEFASFFYSRISSFLAMPGQDEEGKLVIKNVQDSHSTLIPRIELNRDYVQHQDCEGKLVMKRVQDSSSYMPRIELTSREYVQQQDSLQPFQSTSFNWSIPICCFFHQTFLTSHS